MNNAVPASNRTWRVALAKLLVATLVTGFIPVLVSMGPASASAATQLVITSQPTDVTDGVTFSTPVVVSAEDSTPAVDPTYNGTVTASLVGTGTLTNPTVTAVSGVATFTNLIVNAKIGSYSLKFTASPALTTPTSSPFNVSVGAASQLGILTQPAGAASGLALTTQPVVAVEDSGGNVISGTSGTVNAAVVSGTATLTNTSATIISGEAAFSNLIATGAVGNIQLNFYATGISGLATVNSVSFAMKAGNVTKLVITQAPSTNATSGVALATVPWVSLEDSYGNVATTAPATAVSVVIASGSGSLSPSSVTTTAGVAKFLNLAITATTTGPFTLTFSAPGAASVTSATIQVAGAATKLALTTEPAGATTTVKLATQPVVAVEDANGNVVTNYPGTVTASISSGSGLLSGNTATITNGVATFTALTITGATGSYALTFAISPLTSAVSTSFTLTGPASGLSITTQPAGAVNGSAFTTQPVIQVVDASGNAVASATGTVTASISSGSGTLTNATATITNGVATFTTLSVTGATTSLALVFLASGLTSVTSSTLTIPGTATKLVLTTQPTGAVNGTAFTTQPVVTVEDANGTAVTNYSGTVTASISSGSGTLTNATATITNGVATFSGLAYTGSGTFSLSFDSSGLASALSGTLSLSSTATKLALYTQPAGVASGVAFTTQPVVKVEDANGNVVTTYSGTVSASLASGSGTLMDTTVTISNGTAAFSGLSFTGSGTFSLYFTSSGLTSVQSGSLSLAGTGYRLVVLTGPNGAVNGSVLTTQPVLAVEDVNGNVVTNYSGVVTASMANGLGTVTSASATVVNGIANFSGLGINGTAGNVSLYFQSSGASGVLSSVFGLSVGPVTQLVSAGPSVVSSQSALSVQSVPVFKIEDAGGNVVSGYSGTVTASLISGSGVLSGATAPLVNGVATFSNLSITGNVGSYQLRFSVGVYTSASILTLDLTGVPARIVFSVAPSATALSSSAFGVQPVVEIVDASDFVVNSAGGTVTVTMTPTTGEVVNATANVVNGVASFSGLALDAKVGTYTLTFTSSLVSTPLSVQLSLLAGVPTKLVVLAPQSQNALSGQPLMVQPVLHLEDAYGNIVPTSAVAQAVITSASPASASGAAPTLEHNKATGVGGVVRFSGMSVTGASGAVRVTYSVGGLQATTMLVIREPSFFAPLRVVFPPGVGYLNTGQKSQILAFASRMNSAPEIFVTGYSPARYALALFRAGQVKAVLASRLKIPVIIRVDTKTSFHEALISLH